MVEKIKPDVDKLLLVLTIKKMFPIYFAEIKLFLNRKTKSSLSSSVFIFANIFEILKTKFYALWTQTWRNIKSIIYATFLNITCPSSGSILKLDVAVDIVFHLADDIDFEVVFGIFMDAIIFNRVSNSLDAVSNSQFEEDP